MRGTRQPAADSPCIQRPGTNNCLLSGEFEVLIAKRRHRIIQNIAKQLKTRGVLPEDTTPGSTVRLFQTWIVYACFPNSRDRGGICRGVCGGGFERFARLVGEVFAAARGDA